MKRFIGLLCLLVSVIVQAEPHAASGFDHTYFVPGIAHWHGIEPTFWVSDLTIFNPGPDPVILRLTFNGTATPSEHATTLAAREQLLLEDVLISAFSLTSEAGGAIVVESTGVVEVQARTYSKDTSECSGEVRTYGQSYPGMEVEDALTGENLGYLSGLRSDGSYRSNLELMNVGDEAALAEVRFFDAHGLPLGDPVVRSIEPRRRDGVTAALPQGHPSAYAEIRLSSPDSRVIAFASVIDGVSGDPTMIPLIVGPQVDQSSVPLDSLAGVWTMHEDVFLDTTPVVCGKALTWGDAHWVSTMFLDTLEDNRISICDIFGEWGCLDGYVEGNEIKAGWGFSDGPPVLCTNVDDLKWRASEGEWTLVATIENENLMRGTETARYVYRLTSGETVEWISTWRLTMTRR